MYNYNVDPLHVVCKDGGDQRTQKPLTRRIELNCYYPQQVDTAPNIQRTVVSLWLLRGYYAGSLPSSLTAILSLASLL